jgi:hypothetical protein
MRSIIRKWASTGTETLTQVDTVENPTSIFTSTSPSIAMLGYL